MRMELHIVMVQEHNMYNGSKFLLLGDNRYVTKK